MFAANPRQSLAIALKARFECRSAKVHRGLAATTILLGVACQLCDSVMPAVRNAACKLHVLFGLLLFSTILARFLWEMRRTHPPPLADIYALPRHLKRMVYLLLYGLVGVKELVNIGVYLWRGGAFAVGGVRVGFYAANEAAVLASLDDLKVYAAYCVASIFLIRALFSTYGRRVTARSS